MAMKTMLLVHLWVLWVGIAVQAQQCKHFICMSKSQQPTGQSADTFCMQEQLTGKNVFKVYTYSDMCSCIP
jgi:hypothetical protein